MAVNAEPVAKMSDTILRELAEVQYADQLEAIKQNDADTPPANWKLSPRSVLLVNRTAAWTARDRKRTNSDERAAATVTVTVTAT